MFRQLTGWSIMRSGGQLGKETTAKFAETLGTPTNRPTVNSKVPTKQLRTPSIKAFHSPTKDGHRTRAALPILL